MWNVKIVVYSFRFLSDNKQDEVNILKQRLKEAEMIAEQDGFLRKKLSEDTTRLIKENSLLKQQVSQFCQI